MFKPQMSRWLVLL